MTFMQIAIRKAVVTDAASVATIYAHHVLHGTATFDTDPPSPQFWAEKIIMLESRNWPFLVAVHNDRAVGYAYACQFRDRPAYAHTCENSIYIDPASVGQGIGSQLMIALIVAARDAGFQQMIAVVGGGEPASVALHRKAGFRESGRMVNVGMKFGRLLDTVYMQMELTG
jgi:L-amino acid N-acyltransferase YncA